MAASSATSAIGAPQDPVERREVALRENALDKALVDLAHQTGVGILFKSELVEGRRAPALTGRFTVEEAFQRLLAGSGLRVEHAKPGVLVLRAARTPVVLSGQDQRLAPSPDPRALPSGDSPAQDQASIYLPPGEQVTELSEIVVGSHIRGGRNGASPVLVIGREDIDAGGYGTVADALTALPQAFGGSTSDDAATTGSDPTSTNGSRATGVNLRGLGADATLVLINGRRMAGAGLMGDFADVSMIPLAAVERVEVLLDGASALYGSDAVGGVVNVVMRDRWEGVETRARIGGSTHGDLGQRQVAQTFGKAWSHGSVLISAEYQRRDRLEGLRRPYTGNADLRSLGGTDHRLYYSQPGTILGTTSTGALFTAYAIPDDQDGTNLKPSDFIAGQANLNNFRAPIDILPTQERGSFYASLSQNLTDRITLTADARYSDRRYTNYGVGSLTALTVSNKNPFFVSPNGSTSHLIAYSFQNELGGLKTVGEAQSRGFSIGAKVKLPKDWRLEAYALHGEEISTRLSTHQLNSAYLNEALGNTADNPATTFSTARDGYFNPFIGTGKNKRAVLDFIGSGWDSRQSVGLLDTGSITADGSLFRLPAGAVRLAVGGQVRKEGLKTIGYSFTSNIAPTAAFTRRGERTITAVFAEARVPLFGPEFRKPGLERLELSAAVRREDYEGGLSSTVPKFGAVWSPVSAINVKGTYGQSFRTPTLGELNDPGRVSPINISNGSQSVLTLIRYGGNADLKPETAKSATAGLEYAPASRPGLKLAATYFWTRYDDRIDQPASAYISTILTASDLTRFRTFIDPARNPADLALITELLKGATAANAALYPATAYGAIGDARYVNTGRLTVKGVDLTANVPMKVAGDPLVFSANVSWLLDFSRRTTPTAKSVQLVGMAEQPADLRARASAAWTHGQITTTFSLNHTGDLHTAAGKRMPTLTTGDLQVQYASRQDGPLKGLRVALTVQNLLDTDPPFYDSLYSVGYDPANYEVNGRVVALQLTKAW